MSNRKIFKYELRIVDQQDIMLPADYQILKIDTQYDRVCLWCLVYVDNPLTTLTLALHGTGHLVHPDINVKNYIDSFELNGFVGHIFKKE